MKFFFILLLLCVAAHSTPVYESAMVGYWNMNETSGAVMDATGHFSTATTYGTITQGVAGKFGQAYLFNSAGAHIDLGSYSSVSPCTIQAWVKLYGYTAYGTTNPYRTVVQINTHYQGNWSDTALYVTNGYVNPYTAGGSATRLNLNEWTHIAMTNDGSTTRLYINGVLDNSFATTGQWNNGWSFIRIGGGYEGDSESFYGLLDEVAIFNRPLSGSEILAQSQVGLEQYYSTPEPTSALCLICAIVFLIIRKNKFLKQQ